MQIIQTHSQAVIRSAHLVAQSENFNAYKILCDVCQNIITDASKDPIAFILWGKSTRCLLVTFQFLCHGEEIVSTFKILAVNILWGKICHAHGHKLFCITQYFVLIFKCYMFLSKTIIMRRSSTGKYTTIDLHVTLAKIIVFF